MAKLFYTLEETASKLKKSPDEVRELAASGQLPEFRDRDRLMFKVEHVDLLAGTHKADDDMIPLADSGDLEPLSLSSSASASALGIEPTDEKQKEATGISIFDADSTEEIDPSAATQISTSSAPAMKDPGRSGSGSGLLDMTKDADDTSLGANLLDDVYGSDTVAQGTVEETAQTGGDAGGLFESAPSGVGVDEAVGMAAAAAAPAFLSQEIYDGAGSGLSGGLALGAVLALLTGSFAIVLGLTGQGGELINLLGNNIWAIVGGLAGVTLIGGLLGWVLGRKS